MKKVISILFLLIVCFASFGQSGNKHLTESDVAKLFNEQTQKELKIKFPIFKVYEYNDWAGKHYLVLTERAYDSSDNESFNDTIKAFSFSASSQPLKLEWVINDFLKPDAEERSIWFWSKYIELSDIDGDGLADPIITYGTSGLNGYDDGRIKILIYYKGEKKAIRHQNGILDDQRNTAVDQSFYKLPHQIQLRVEAIMRKMEENNHANFPGGWETAMEQKKVKLDKL